MKTKIIYLFGHRKQHGKDTCANIMYNLFLKEGLKKEEIYKTNFAKNVKKIIALKYGLDESLMESNNYKEFIPNHLNKSVRQILISEGNFSRSIWEDVWAWSVYKEIFESSAYIFIISDFRFENEYTSFEKLKKIYFQNKKEDCHYKLYKILVKRENGIYENDGADNQLPDDESYYDFTIYNLNTNDWYQKLEKQIFNIIEKTYKIYNIKLN